MIAIITTFILVSICNWLCLFIFHDNIAKNRQFKSHAVVTKIIEWFYRFNSNYSKKILFSITCITLTALFGLKYIYKETNFLDSFFVSNSDIYQDFMFLDNELSGSGGINILFKGQKSDQFKNIESLNILKSLETELSKHESIKYIRSYRSPISMIHQGLASDNSKLPNNQEALEQELLFLEFSQTDSSEDILAPYINFDYSAMQMRIYTNNLNSKKTEELVSFINETLDNMQIKASITGANMYTHTLGHYVIDTQITSIIITLLAIALVIYLFLGVKAGILCLIANSVPIIILFGFMGYFNIPIDFSTILIIGISLGISVDNNIHFLHLYKESKKLEQHSNHLYCVLHIVGRPIIYTTMLLSLCIGVFVISDLFILAKFGLFTVIAILLSALCSFILLPLLIKITDNKID
jgi:predicted RND superfamily exporter protein